MTEPTDAELIDAYDSTPAHGNAQDVHVAGLRAVLAKFGTPPAVAGKPDYATFALWYADHIGDENKPVRDAALATYEAFATPQPTQTQAGAVPLTKEQRSRIVLTVNTVSEAIDMVERHHGIKGGQHGADAIRKLKEDAQ